MRGRVGRLGHRCALSGEHGVEVKKREKEVTMIFRGMRLECVDDRDRVGDTTSV